MDGMLSSLAGSWLIQTPRHPRHPRQVRVGASASLLRTPEFFTEEVPGVPGGPIRVRGHVKSQEKVRFGEKGGSVQIHRLVQIVGGLMVACSSPHLFLP